MIGRIRAPIRFILNFALFSVLAIAFLVIDGFSTNSANIIGIVFSQAGAVLFISFTLAYPASLASQIHKKQKSFGLPNFFVALLALGLLLLIGWMNMALGRDIRVEASRTAVSTGFERAPQIVRADQGYIVVPRKGSSLLQTVIVYDGINGVDQQSVLFSHDFSSMRSDNGTWNLKQVSQIEEGLVRQSLLVQLGDGLGAIVDEISFQLSNNWLRALLLAGALVALFSGSWLWFRMSRWIMLNGLMYITTVVGLLMVLQWSQQEDAASIFEQYMNADVVAYLGMGVIALYGFILHLVSLLKGSFAQWEKGE